MAETCRMVTIAVLNNPQCWSLLWHDTDAEAYDEVWDVVEDVVSGLDFGAFLVRVFFNEDDQPQGSESRPLTADEWARLREGKAPWEDGLISCS